MHAHDANYNNKNKNNFIYNPTMSHANAWFA